MPRAFHTCLTLFAVWAGVAACDSPKRLPGSEPLSADTAWATLTSSGPRPERRDGEMWLTYFMRQVELTDQRRRELGVVFWDEYPEDPRRYQWLLATVHMPSRYPLDLQQWATNEFDLSPNGAPIDERAVAKWEARYPEMREAFWKAPEVTDRERRFLWFGEVKHSILRAREAHARGENVDTAKILDEVLAFAATYRKPTGELDTDQYYGIFNSLTNLVFREDLTEDGDPLFSWKVDEALAYWSRMMDTGSRGLEKYNPRGMDQYLLQQGSLPVRQPLLQRDSADERAWRTLQTSDGAYLSTPVGRAIRAYNTLIKRQKSRELGLRLWDRVPNHEMRSAWLGSTQWSFTSYPTHIADYLQAVADNFAQLDYLRDDNAIAEWNARYAVVRGEFWDHPLTSQTDRAGLEAKELWKELMEGGADRKLNAGTSMSFLERVQEHILQYPYVTTQKSVYSTIVRQYRSYGLSEDDLQSFVEPILDDDSDLLREISRGALEQIALRRTPFEFRGPDLHGNEFDLESLRGNIVLVDHWSTRCASCIAAKPRIQDIYKRYRDRGFEVVSICYDATTERKRVLRIKDELGLSWLTLDGESQREAIFNRYGFTAVPQYMLLNRDGRMYAGTGEVDFGKNLEVLLNEMLAAEAVSEGSENVL